MRENLKFPKEKVPLAPPTRVPGGVNDDVGRTFVTQKPRLRDQFGIAPAGGIDRDRRIAITVNDRHPQPKRLRFRPEIRVHEGTLEIDGGPS